MLQNGSEPVKPGIANRYSLSEQVRNYIVHKISSGELKPGDRIVEDRIAEELHVSSIPVREAIRDLVARRMLEHAMHKGARVREVSLAETVDALQVKGVLESLAARLAGARLLDALPVLRKTVKPILDSALRRDFVAYQDHNQLFHRAIVEASGNQILINLWDSLSFDVRTRFIMDSLHLVDPYELAKGHEAILQAIEAADPDKVASLVETHACDLVERLKKQMAADGSAAG
jgi:DNA-binding GntR family transcriptional regulator